jgi:hypothetical protein
MYLHHENSTSELSITLLLDRSRYLHNHQNSTSALFSITLMLDIPSYLYHENSTSALSLVLLLESSSIPAL